MSDELARLDAVGQAELVRSGEISPSELLDATLDRIDALDPELNAVIHRMDDKAREEAASPDLPDGPFRGVPMLIKDLWPSSAGDPFHMGIKAFAEAGYRHPTDAHLVTRYRQAGFVVAGRTNTPELGLMATTEPLAYGPTRNPWDTSRSPGGSSGGAAAAVAAGMVPMANASDGGGSIRIPAAMCGLVGLKPSRGRVSMGPLQDEWGVSTQHIVSHTVRDTAAVLDVSRAPFHGDGVIAPAIGQPYADQVGADPGSLRIGVLTEARGGVETHPECLQAVADAAALLERSGHRVSDDSPAALDDPEVRLAFGVLWGVNAKANLVALGRMLGRELGPDDVEPGTWAMVERAEGVGGVDVVVAQGAQHRFRRAVQEWWNGFDLLLTPTTARPPAPLGVMVATDDDPMRGLTESIPYAAFTSPFNITGQPGVSLPLHTTADGLPVGVQLVAAYGREDLLIRVAAQLEAEVRWADRRAPMHP